jgi:hypothetical protein
MTDNCHKGSQMKRSRRVVLTMMGTAAIGTVSMGFVRRLDCPPGYVPVVIAGPNGRPVATCGATYGVTYGGFGGGPYYHGRGNFHGGG